MRSMFAPLGKGWCSVFIFFYILYYTAYEPCMIPRSTIRSQTGTELRYWFLGFQISETHNQNCIIYSSVSEIPLAFSLDNWYHFVFLFFSFCFSRVCLIRILKIDAWVRWWFGSSQTAVPYLGNNRQGREAKRETKNKNKNKGLSGPSLLKRVYLKHPNSP